VSTERNDFNDLFSDLTSVSYIPDDSLVSHTGAIVDDFINMAFEFRPELVLATGADDDRQPRDADFWSSMDNSQYPDLGFDLDLPINNAVVPTFDTFINYDAEESISGLM